MTVHARPTCPDGGAASPGSLTEGMVRVPGGTFLMGSADFYPEERPAHLVTVDGFWMDELPVTNADFGRFVDATGHVTVARGRGRRPVPKELAGQPVSGTWPVDEVAVVRSRLDARGARYDTIATIPLAGGGAVPDAT